MVASAIGKGSNNDKRGKVNKPKLKNGKMGNGNVRLNNPGEKSKKINGRQGKNISTSTNPANLKRPSKLKRTLKAGKAVGKVFTGNIARRIAKKPGNMGKRTLRFAAGSILGGAAGAFGVAAGVASGDPSKALQYGITGAGAGMYAGSKVSDLATNTTEYVGELGSGAGEAAQKAYYGEEYKQRQQDKQIKQWKNNKEYRQKIEDKVGEEEAKLMYDNGEIDDYLKYNIDDISDMLAIHQLQKAGVAKDREQAVAVHEYAQRIGDTSKMQKENKHKWKDTFKEEFQQAGYSEEDAERASNDTFDKIVYYNNIRFNL